MAVYACLHETRRSTRGGYRDELQLHKFTSIRAVTTKLPKSRDRDMHRHMLSPNAVTLAASLMRPSAGRCTRLATQSLRADIRIANGLSPIVTRCAGTANQTASASRLPDTMACPRYLSCQRPPGADTDTPSNGGDLASPTFNTRSINDHGGAEQGIDNGRGEREPLPPRSGCWSCLSSMRRLTHSARQLRPRSRAARRDEGFSAFEARGSWLSCARLPHPCAQALHSHVAHDRLRVTPTPRARGRGAMEGTAARSSTGSTTTRLSLLPSRVWGDLLDPCTTLRARMGLSGACSSS
ncbi:hypothetical protein C8J57DRAFT_1509688 [Mycena rebaudengoi]|nr:hypothetical protein C8J57DRAFT_1509688 [Mycena rebaudengoi]